MATENGLEPTLIPATNFDANADAKALRGAMKGFGTNETTIIEILTNRSNAQRQTIKRAFQLSFGRNLVDDLESELRGKLEKLMLALMDPPAAYMAKELQNAMKGFGTDCDALTEVLCTKTNEEIKQIAEMYKKWYKEKLEDAFESEKEIDGEYKRLLLLLLSGVRDETATCPDKAKEQAEKLFATGEGKWQSNPEIFVDMLAKESLDQLRLIFTEYERLSNKKVYENIEEVFSGKMKTAVITIVKCAFGKVEYYAEKLEIAMKGLGTDDSTLIRIIVSRCEIDLGNIKKVYEDTYKKSLYSAVESETSGDYKKAILNLIQP